MKKNAFAGWRNNDPVKTALRMNHVAIGAGTIGLLGFSLVEYFYLPSLWGVFLAVRIGLAVWGMGLLVLTMVLKRGAQAALFAFWIPVLLAASLAVSRLPSESSLFLWNIHLCIIILFIANVAVSPPQLSWILSGTALVSYIICFQLQPGVSFQRMLVNGGILYMAGIVIMFPLMMARYRLLSHNITMQMKITDQNRELAQLNSSKDRFFSIIAHDLKGPIGSSARVLNRMVEGDSENEKEELAVVCEAVTRSYSMLENLLLWARSQRGELTIIPVELNTHRLVEQVWDEFKEEAEAKEVALEDRTDPLHAMVTDKKTMLVIFRNLLSNAVRYSKPGGKIIVSSQKRDGRMVIEVRDNGEGMEKETVDRLFKIDEKQNNSSSDGVRGTGLGLILSRELAEKNDGVIRVASEFGKGTSFFLELPSA